MVGGILDAYTFVGRGGVFANAQTGNIVLMAIEASRENWRQVLVNFAPILAFILGVIVVETIKRNSPFFIPDWSRAILMLEAIVLFVIGFTPSTIPNEIVTVTISFVSSIQISSFRKLVDSAYSTTMSTGNLRTALEAAYIAVMEKNTTAAIRAIRYITILISFFIGGLIGALLTLDIGVKAIWSAVFILICSLILFNIDEHRTNSSKKILGKV
jgi:uncharacterized membrane protein YoaK (UPF0700 family)